MLKTLKQHQKYHRNYNLVPEHRLHRMRLASDESDSLEPIKVRSSKVGLIPVGLSSTQGWYIWFETRDYSKIHHALVEKGSLV
jgi:hypothetical protein